MADYGVTPSGFIVKPIAAILADKGERAKEMFGSDVDLRSTSALRKLLDVSAAEDAELWKRLENQYYAIFVSTASGDALNLLGEDVGITRPFQFATGDVKLKLSGESPGRLYHLPIGTLIETSAPVRQFRLDRRVTLHDQHKEESVSVTAAQRGPDSNVALNAIDKINVVYAQRHLDLGSASITAANDVAPTTGGERPETDEYFRDKLLGFPRTVWTLQRLRETVKSVDGVRDCRLFDPLGGTDVSLSKFMFFLFSQRRFGTQRLLGTPYFFDVLVAIQPGLLWDTEGTTVGMRDTIADAIREVRPIGIFPNVRQADNVIVGIRARVLTKGGQDKNAVRASIKANLERRVNALGLGGAVLYSEVLVDCMSVAGVADVQDLHLRRCPPYFTKISFGRRQRFRGAIIEASVGENLALLPSEIAVFTVDSPSTEIEVRDR